MSGQKQEIEFWSEKLRSRLQQEVVIQEHYASAPKVQYNMQDKKMQKQNE